MVHFEDWAANAVSMVPSTSLLPAFLSLPLGIEVLKFPVPTVPFFLYT